MLLAFLFLCMSLGMLTHAGLCREYALLGLKTWAFAMVPSLFPFMVLSGLLTGLGLAERFVSFLSPLICRTYRCSKACCYVIFMGFFCGFPMGARSACELYDRGQLSEEEVRWLLAFCNNIGPAYFGGIVLPLLGLKHALPYWIGTYGIPYVYGILLRAFFFRRKLNTLPSPAYGSEKPRFGETLTESIESAIHAILMLGAYVVLFSLMNLVPHLLFSGPQPIFGALFEISTGIQALGGKHMGYCLLALTFGGLSCLAQTHATLPKELSHFLGEYCVHRVILTALTLLYYLAASFLFGVSFSL